jgi:hypothetical protein
VAPAEALPVRIEGYLPEVIRLHDARGERPPNAVGVGEFWYEPEIWSLPLSPASRVLYAALCAFLGHGEINRKDLRNALKDCSDAEILGSFEDLGRYNLLSPTPKTIPGGTVVGYAVRSIRDLEG